MYIYSEKRQSASIIPTTWYFGKGKNKQTVKRIIVNMISW